MRIFIYIYMLYMINCALSSTDDSISPFYIIKVICVSVHSRKEYVINVYEVCRLGSLTCA